MTLIRYALEQLLICDWEGQLMSGFGIMPSIAALIRPLLSNIDMRSPTMSESRKILRQKPSALAALRLLIAEMFPVEEQTPPRVCVCVSCPRAFSMKREGIWQFCAQFIVSEIEDSQQLAFDSQH